MGPPSFSASYYFICDCFDLNSLLRFLTGSDGVPALFSTDLCGVSFCFGKLEEVRVWKRMAPCGSILHVTYFDWL